MLDEMIRTLNSIHHPGMGSGGYAGSSDFIALFHKMLNRMLKSKTLNNPMLEDS